MILTLTFYSIEEKGSEIEKEYLQGYLVENDLWKNLDFWKSSIYNSIINETKMQRNYYSGGNETGIEKNLREKNIVFGQLAAFGQNMLMFGIEKKVILLIISKFFDYFELEENQIDNLKVLFK